MGKENTQPRLFSPVFILLIVLNTVTSAGFYMTMPTLPKYALSVGLTLTLAGTLSGVFSISSIIIRPFAGWIADSTNKKWLLAGSTAVICLSMMGYSFAKGAYSLFAVRLLHGAAFAVSSTTHLAFATCFIPKERMGEGVSYMGFSQILAMAIAPNLGLQISASLGYEAMFRISAVLIGLAAFCMVFIPYENNQALLHEKPKRKVSNLIAFDLLSFTYITALFSMSNGIATSFLSLLADERGISGVGMFFTLSSVAVLIARLLTGKLMDKRGLGIVVIPSLIMGAGSLAMVGWARVLWPILVAGCLKGIGQSAGQSGVQAECARRVDATRRGVAMATCYLGNDIGQGLGTSLGGYLSATMGYGGMFLVMGAAMLTGILMYAIQVRIDHKKAKGL